MHGDWGHCAAFPAAFQMDPVPDVFQVGECPKRSSGEGLKLSPYQNLLRYYERLQESYGWTMQEVDATDIAFLLDQLCVIALVSAAGKQKYIDDVM